MRTASQLHSEYTTGELLLGKLSYVGNFEFFGHVQFKSYFLCWSFFVINILKSIAVIIIKFASMLLV